MTTEQKQKYFAIFIILFGGLGGILYGYDLGAIAGALIFMKQEITLSTAQISILAAAVLGGGSIATLIAGPLSDWWGRRTMITLSALVFIAGIIVLVSSHTFSGVLTGRLIEGVGVGIITIIVPLYLAETAPAAIRGSSVTAFQLFLTSGILLAYIISLLFVHTASWRGMFLCSLIPAGLLLVGSLFIIESPRWLFLRGKKEKTLEILKKTRTQEEAEHDVFLMTKLEVEKTNGEKKARVWKKHYLLPFIIAFAIAILNQLTGINVFLQLCTFILKNSGLHSNVISMMGSVGIGVVNFAITLVAIAIVDKLGRKPLLIFGTTGIVISLLFLGLINILLQPGVLQGYLTLAGFILFVISYGIGPGVVVWLALSELMPTAIRGIGMSICLFGNSLASALLASVFLGLTQYIGYAGVFWMCGGFTIIYMLISIFLLPETKNKSLEEIEQYFQAKTVKE